MADGRELKPKSFRIDEETAEKFKEISGQIGGNQQETLSKLIEAFEFQSGKAILTDKKAEIERFEQYVTVLTRMYMGSLEDNQNLTLAVRSEYEALLQSKDSVIQNLQEQLSVAKQLKEQASESLKGYMDENQHLSEAFEEMKQRYDSKMQDMQSMILDKNNLNKALTDSCNELKKKVDEMKPEHDKLSELYFAYENMERNYEKAKETLANCEKELAQTQEYKDKIIVEMNAHEKEALDRQKEQMQLSFDKKMLDFERENQEYIKKLENEKQEEINKYQQKYLDLLEKIQSEHKQ